MIEHKFRAIYKGEAEFLYNKIFYSQIIDGEMWFVCQIKPKLKYKASYVFGNENWIVNSCAYVKDMDNNYIYEGDIMPFELSNKTIEYYYIKYNTESCEYEAINKDSSNYILPCLWKGSKVVGNIFENEVLLDNPEAPSVGKVYIIDFDGKNVYLKSKWFRNNQDLQVHIDEVYKDVCEYIKDTSRVIDNLKSRNLFQRIFRKYE